LRLAVYIGVNFQQLSLVPNIYLNMCVLIGENEQSENITLIKLIGCNLHSTSVLNSISAFTRVPLSIKLQWLKVMYMS